MTKEIDLAWAAGFFEGEGCVSFKKKNPNARGEIRKYVIANVSQTNMYPLERFKGIVGFGEIYGYTRERDNNTYYEWNCFNEDAHKLMKLLEPYLSDKCVKYEKYTKMVLSGEYEKLERVPRSEDHNKKISESLKIFWENKKETVTCA